MSTRNNHSRGFTLIEMLIVAPIVILVIAAFIALTISLTGRALQLRAENTVAYNTQDTLDRIERFVNLASKFNATTGGLTAPLGKNDSTTAFASDDPATLILESPATTDSPLKDTRDSVYYNAPNSCGTPAEKLNSYYTVQYVFFVDSNKTLWQRTLPGPLNSGICQTPWQLASCKPGYTSSTCRTNDTKLLDNVSAFTINYHDDPATDTALPAIDAPLASTVTVGITVSQQAAGRPVTFTSSIRASSFYLLNS